ncbi:MAG: 4Fe-4S binding protein [Clostridiales bacterium]|nr:4Fe-4S binding protein [Clostridiales bacterium]
MIALSSETVKEYGLGAGASVVGIAASKDFFLAPDGFKPTDILGDCLSVIVLGVPSPKEALTMDPPDYTALRNEKLTEMTDIAKKVAKRIKADGYQSKAISASGGKTVEIDGRKEHFGYISLKHAAEIAGLGVIGKNYLLTSLRYGNLLWLSAVLTDAPLTPDDRVAQSICEGCNQCVEACPAGALDDIPPFGKKGCSQYFRIENKKFLIKCYQCRAVCPKRFGVVEGAG